MVKAKQQRRRNRRLPDSAVPSTVATANVTGVEAATPNVIVTFNSPVMIDPGNLPTSWTFGTALRTLVSIVSATPTVIEFITSGTLAAAEDYEIGALDPAARTTTGGYIAAATGAMS